MINIFEILQNIVEQDKYKERVEEAKERGEGSILIDYEDISQQYPTVGVKIIEETQEISKKLLGYIKRTYPDSGVKNIKFENIRLISLKEAVKSEYANQIISTEGIVRIRGDLSPRPYKATFVCPCGEYEEEVTWMEGGEFKLPKICPECDKVSGEFEKIKTEYMDRRWINIQESPEGMEVGTEPVQLKVMLEDELARDPVEAGDLVKITGVLSVMMKGTGKNKRHEFFLKGNNLEREDRKYEDLEIGDEEKEEIINLSKTPDLYKKVIGSIAPRIEGKGMGEVKRAIALQLFGGVPELEEDGVLVPGDINILLIGDPGIGKTHIIKHISGNLAPRGIYTTGAGSSGVGLTASVIKKSDYGGEYRVEAGPMVLGDKGIVCIDEFDKMPPEERGKIHEALSNQTVTIAKAGVNITFNSRCTVLGGANPKGDRIDIGKSIKEQIDLPSSIIDRFDLLYILQDIVDEEEDWKVASSSVDKDYREESNKNKIPQDMLRKYIAYARTNIEPELNDEAKESIKKYYVTTRGNREDNDPIPITPRFLNTLKKLSQARARMELRETVTSEDVEEGVDIVKNCLETVGMDPITGRMDIDRAEGRTPAIEKDLRKIIKNIVEEYELDRRSDYSWFNNEETREEAIETIIEQSRVIDRPDTREKLEEKLREEISFRVSGVREEEEEE